MKLLKIDEQGFFIEDIVTDKIPTITETQIDENGNQIEVEIPNPLYITVPCPNDKSFYKPKWNGTEWVEGKPQEEIDEIKNRPTEPTEIEILRLEQAQSNAELFEMMLMLTGGVS